MKIYQSKWKVFRDWCSDKDIDFRQPSTAQVAEFLLSLFEEKKLCPKTIEGYRTAIAGALKHTSDHDFGADQSLSALLRSFNRDRPRDPSRIPEWDLSFVLFSLSREPFEPLRDKDMDLQLLTWKTCFLLLLASGARRGEVHALTHRGIKFHEKWDWVQLKPSPSFISKTQLRTTGASALQPMVIPSLKKRASDKKDLTLCPVRALQIYLSRTMDRREGKDNLFVSLNKNHKGDISKNTISGWIKKLIHRIYANGNAEACQLAGRDVHLVRKYASTLMFSGTSDMDSLLQACSWKSHTTFTDFYLRDLTGMEQNLLRLGPVVAAQHVVNH